MYKYLITLAIATLVFLGSFAQSTAQQWYDKGISLKKSKKYSEAIVAFKKAVSFRADYGEALHQLGWCYNEEGSYDDAIDALLKEAKAGPAALSYNKFELGYANKGLKNYDEALSYFNEAIDLDADYTLAFKERGNTYFKQKEYDKATDDFEKYETLAKGDITDATYYYNRGWMENDRKKYADAVPFLKKCLLLDNHNVNGYTELGYSYYELNLNDNALANYRRAMALDATDYHPLLGIADVYYDNLKNYDSAVVYYEKGTRIQKKNKSAFYRLGWCYNDRDRWSAAIDPLLQAILLDPDYNKARNELGYAYYKLKRYDEGLAQFRPVMENDEKDELSRYYAGFCYYLKDDQDNLKKMIDELKALNSTKYVETLTKYVK